MIRATRGRSMDGWMDGEDLIVCVAFQTLYKRWAPLIFADSRVIAIASRNQMRSRLHLFASRIDFGGTWGGLGRSKWKLKSIFGRLFAMPSSSALLNRFLNYFFKSEPWFFCAQPVFCKDFHQVEVFGKAWKRSGFGVRFGRPKRRKIEKT